MNTYKNTLNIFIFALSAAVMMLAVYFVDGPKTIFHTLKEADFLYLTLALSFVFISWIIESFALKELVSVKGLRIPFKESFHSTMTGILFNQLTPLSSGGQPMEIYQLTQYGIPIGVGSSAMMMLLLLYHIFALAGGIAVFIYLYFYSDISTKTMGPFLWFGFFLNFAVTFVLVAVIYSPQATNKRLEKFIRFLGKMHILKNPEKNVEKLENELAAFYDSFYFMRQEGFGRVFRAGGYYLLSLIFLFGAPYFIFSALGQEISFITVLLGIACVSIISSYVPLPGASLGAEGGFYLVFSALLPEGTGLALVIIFWRICTFYFPIITGNLVRVLLGKKKTFPRELNCTKTSRTAKHRRK